MPSPSSGRWATTLGNEGATARAFPRVEGILRVSYATLDQLVVAYSTDLSRGGMFLASRDPLPVGGSFQLTLELPQGGGDLIVNCRVIYVRDEAASKRTGKPAGMGIQFLDLREAELSQIGHFIADQGRGSLDGFRPLRAKPLKVLVVDDDMAAREAAAKPFRDRGDHVSSAGDGVAALAACLREPPDVIVSDVQMPRMDGWQLARIVRSRPELAEVPLLFLTGIGSEDERLRGYQLGVDDFVAKPPRPEELLARVDRFVRRLNRDAPESQTMLRGKIEHVPLASVLTLLELEKKTGILRVVSSATARFHIAQGAIMKVEMEGQGAGAASRRMGTLSGNGIASRPSPPPARPPSREALKAALRWTSGHFDFFASEVTCENEIRSSVTSMLLDLACSDDEADRGGDLQLELDPPASRTTGEESFDLDELDWDPNRP